MYPPLKVYHFFLFFLFFFLLKLHNQTDIILRAKYDKKLRKNFNFLREAEHFNFQRSKNRGSAFEKILIRSTCAEVGTAESRIFFIFFRRNIVDCKAVTAFFLRRIARPTKRDMIFYSCERLTPRRCSVVLIRRKDRKNYSTLRTVSLNLTSFKIVRDKNSIK